MNLQKLIKGKGTELICKLNNMKYFKIKYLIPRHLILNK